ncbi:ribbon-helix-helix domain-containing protein [Pseudoroseomonas ludipueritiae]|uniref:Type II toxin-antitoxin system ParD family antitoxin n=1 Tax=Pseudoroseomonas ludipueritiae TaxID=198093 RepID=A0ABR7R385_9PROT|nr:type II toxin-antitoxin system ParD family antitoxin [Pseudoroseomonas ludipueritiae]MBC9176181.1 type II toxin-antitoxin system ParD family antitoxin [Pseudoroseomonas ludipueritiae]
METLISLTDDEAAFARSLVESGQHPSLAAVLRRGLELLRHDVEERDAELRALRKLVERRSAENFVGLAEGEVEIHAMLERRKARGARTCCPWAA